MTRRAWVSPKCNPCPTRTPNATRTPSPGRIEVPYIYPTTYLITPSDFPKPS